MRLPDPDTSRAVIIGTRAYDVASGLAELPGVTGNVNGLMSALVERTGLRPQHCLTLLDHTDDRAVCQVVRRAADEAEDLLLVYFAGHGLIGPDGRELFLALSRSNPQDPLFTSVRFAELRDLITRSRARNRVLILDCCYSGRAITDTMGTAEDIAFAQTEVSGAYTLTATSATRTALAPVGERRTLFTGALLDLLDTGVPGGGPLLTLGTLHAELRRTLTPQPRQQGTDTAAALALTVNPAHRIEEQDDQATGGTPGEGDRAAGDTNAGPVTFTVHPALKRARRLVAVFRWLAALTSAAVMLAAVPFDRGSLTDPRVIGLGVVVAAAVLLLLRIVLPRLPRRYELLVDECGLCLTADHGIQRIRWDDVQRVTTMRSAAGRIQANRVVVWPRRGFVPPRRQRVGPRMDRARGVLWFCRLGWLSASEDEVTSVIRRHAPGLWDDAHGLRATLPVAVFHKRRVVRAAGVFWAVFFAALGALGLIGFASAWQVATALGVCWLAVWGTLGLYVLAIGLLPARLRIDRHGIGIRANLGRLDVAWPDVEDVVIRSGKHGPELHVRTPRRPTAHRPFSGRLSIPYDPRSRTVTLVTAALAVSPDELDAALARFAGHRWQGRQDAPDEPGDDAFGADFTLVGRLAGPRSKAVWVLGLSGASALPVFLASVLDGGASLTLALVTAALTLLAGIMVGERCELCLDGQAVELRTATSRTRVPWPLVSRATVARVSEFTLTGPAPALVLWFKQGASVPAKWRWRECFVPHSGGVAVVGIRAFDGVRGDERELSTALRHFAGRDRTDRHHAHAEESTDP